jgi:hypothetical protein
MAKFGRIPHRFCNANYWFYSKAIVKIGIFCLFFYYFIFLLCAALRCAGGKRNDSKRRIFDLVRIFFRWGISFVLRDQQKGKNKDCWGGKKKKR